MVPVFDRLRSQDKSGISWLPRLLKLPTGGNDLTIPVGCRCDIKDSGWGDSEKKFATPRTLLKWIIENPSSRPTGTYSGKASKTLTKRRQWLAGSKERIREGLQLLQEGWTKTGWHIFEGSTQPDVYVETDDLITVIEGKRTEREPTRSTKWMKGRHQMLRHLDCAWEIRGDKRIVGFFIVEGDGTSPNVPDRWHTFAQEAISPKAIASSLPHRTSRERERIASCFIGVTTWQMVCHEFRDFGLSWRNLT